MKDLDQGGQILHETLEKVVLVLLLARISVQIYKGNVDRDKRIWNLAKDAEYLILILLSSLQ